MVDATSLLQQLEHDRKHVYVLTFYRSDCPYTAPTREAMRPFFEWLQTEYADKVKTYSIMDGAIQTFRDGLGISRDEMPTVPSVVVYYQGHRKWFLARLAPLSIQMQHFKELLASIPQHHRGRHRAAGGDEKEHPVFLTYYFHPLLRHDPIHMTIVGALFLLQSMRHTPIRFESVEDVHMHGVLSVHANVNRTFKGHAAANYLAVLLEVNQRLGLTDRSHQKHSKNRQGGADGGGGASWADYLTGFTVVAAMLV
jgi:hypothetical protein